MPSPHSYWRQANEAPGPLVEAKLDLLERRLSVSHLQPVQGRKIYKSRASSALNSTEGMATDPRN